MPKEDAKWLSAEFGPAVLFTRLAASLSHSQDGWLPKGRVTSFVL